jgi:ketosteroid isomerase-like protein
VLERLLDGISRQDWAGLADLYAENVVVEIPFATPAPIRIEGREQVARHFADASGVPLKFRVENLVVHETADPEVVVAEFDYDGLVTTTGHAFTVPNVQVLRVRGGRIVASRDYHHHAAMAAALRAAVPA